jgi:hypothetical protein
VRRLIVTSRLAVTVLADVLSNGDLVRETTSPEVFVICDGRRVRVPTPSAMEHLLPGKTPQVLADGALSAIERIDLPSHAPVRRPAVSVLRNDQRPVGLLSERRHRLAPHAMIRTLRGR